MASHGKTSPAPAAAPRLAATVLLVRDTADGIEVLMARRHAAMHFPSALVFPGGLVDPGDRAADWLACCDDADTLDEEARALRIAACRETFEETGILLARGMRDPGPANARFIDRIATGGGRLPLGALQPFGHWITPAGAPKRFDTHFFLCRAPEDAAPVCDGRETIALEWTTPSILIARNDAGDDSLMFPTRLNLLRLGESGTVDQAFAAAAARPPFTVSPRVEEQANGVRFSIPAEAGYPECEGLYPRLR